MQFKRLPSGEYQATRKDGQVITIYKLNAPWGQDKWASTYEGDFHGHCNGGAPTKRELVEYENWVEENATEESLSNSNYM